MPPDTATRRPSLGCSPPVRTRTHVTISIPRPFTWRQPTVGSGRWRAFSKAVQTRTRAELDTTALHHAAEGGHADAVATLVAAGADPNAGDAFNTTPIHHAAWLIGSGANVDAKDSDGRTPLDFARKGGDPAVIDALMPRRPGPARGGRPKW